MRVLVAVLFVGIVGCGGEDSPDDGAAPSSPTISPVKAENAATGVAKSKPENVVAQSPQAKTKKRPVEAKTVLDGEWSVVSAKIGGTPTKAYDNQRFSFQGEQISQLIADGKPSLVSRYRLSAVRDPALPREFDWIQNDGKTYRGLLRIATDRLEFCVAQPGNPRPKNFGVSDSLSVVLKKNAGNATNLVGHSLPVWSVGFSPDGKRIVSGSYDKTLKVWDAQTGKETLTLNGHSDIVYSVSFSPDGKRIVSGSRDKSLKVWDAQTGQELLTLNGHSGNVFSVSFSPDGKRIVSGSYDKTVKLWDAQTGKETLTLNGHSFMVQSASFSPDGKQIVSGSVDYMLKVWDVQTGQETITLKEHSGEVESVGFSPDGKRIVSGSWDKTLIVWDISPLNESKTKSAATVAGKMLTLKGHSSAVWSVSFSPDGKRIVSGGHDKTIKIWDAQTGQEILTLYGHSEPVRSVRFSPDGKRIVSASDDKTIKIWSSTTPRPTSK